MARIEPTGQTLGATVHDVDLSRPLDDRNFAEILKALGDHGVLRFPAQHLEPADLAAFSRRLGTLQGSVTGTYCEPGMPEVMILSNVVENGQPIGTLAQLPFRRTGDRAYGPGIYDMKGGTYLAVEAIRQLQKAGIQTPLPITVLLTPDEEVGSPSSRDLIEAEARRHRFVLVPEPARPDGGLVTGRYAIARFNLEATGRPSHAGARLAEGRSAIRELARQILAIEDMTTEDCTFSVGVVHGGQWVNCVTTRATGEALCMAKRQEDLDRGVERMLALSASSNEVAFKVTRGITRPVWEHDAGTEALFARAAAIAAEIGFTVTPQSAGGGSDGNFTGALGIPTLDGLGVEGAGGHTLEEHIVVASLARRGRLMAGLLASLGG